MTKRWMGTTIVLAALATGVAACSSGGGESGAGAPSATSGPDNTAAPAHPAQAKAPAQTKADASDTHGHTGSSGGTAASSSVPVYRPSTVVSQSPFHTQLTSANSVATVSAFYENWVKNGGWSVISQNHSAYNTSIVARHGSRGATVSISSNGRGGVGISLSSYST